MLFRSKTGSAHVGLEMDVATDLSFLPEEEDLEAQLDAQDEPLLLRKTVLPAEPLVRKDLPDSDADVDLDLPLFSGKRVDKADDPVLK